MSTGLNVKVEQSLQQRPQWGQYQLFGIAEAQNSLDAHGNRLEDRKGLSTMCKGLRVNDMSSSWEHQEFQQMGKALQTETHANDMHCEDQSK